MSALSKFRTTNRPRWAVGVGGTVGGGGVGSRRGTRGARSAGSIVRGPIATGEASVGGADGAGAATTGAGARSVGVGFGGVAQAARNDTRTTAAATSLWRRRIGRLGGNASEDAG